MYALRFTPFVADTDFVALGSTNNAWNVVRSEFDELLLKHAEECGARVYTQTRVETFEFEPCSVPEAAKGSSHVAGVHHEKDHASSNRSRSHSLGGRSVEFEPMGRPVKARYTAADGEQGEIKFDYLIDASGRAGVLSTK